MEPVATTVDRRALSLRRRILELSHRAHVGHIGSCLCVAEILAALTVGPWFRFGSSAVDRDRLVLGKGHAGLALYAALEAMGILKPEVLNTFAQDGSVLGVHPEAHVDGVDFSSGSLGQGLGTATGSALGARILGHNRSTVAVLSDAECNAGATWEAAHFAGHHRLGRLVAVVDANGQQALGSTRDILDPEPFSVRWDAAGWEVREVDGHHAESLIRATEPLTDGPVVVIARTVFGRGVSFMEGQLDWHYLPMTDEQFALAIEELHDVDA